MPPIDAAEAISPPSRSIGAIVLAAGMSQRMGRLKMLLPFGNRPMLARVIESLRMDDGSAPVTVVTGYAEQEIRAVVVEYTNAACAHNDRYAEGGMLSSIKTGICALPHKCDAFFLVLGDQPMVMPHTMARLRSAWHPDIAPIVVPSHRAKRGHPVLISCRFTAEILALGEHDTLKTFIARHAEGLREVPVDDPATIFDIDTPEDYESALLRWREAGELHG